MRYMYIYNITGHFRGMKFMRFYSEKPCSVGSYLKIFKHVSSFMLKIYMSIECKKWSCEYTCITCNILFVY